MALIPFDDRDGSIWMDGEIVPWRDAKAHTLSHGLHYASLVFEGERVYAGKSSKGANIRFGFANQANCWILICRFQMMRWMLPNRRSLKPITLLMVMCGPIVGAVLK